MVDASGLSADEAVLEVGPGIATLTNYLADKAKFVLSVEKDAKFGTMLKRFKKEHKNFRYEIADILSFNFQEALKEYPRYRVVANIPYYITGKIIQLFLRAEHKPQSITLLVQNEVAHNISARPGQLNLLAISVQLFGEPRFVQKVPARSFYPAPKVDSAIIHIDLSGGPRYAIADEKKLFRVLRACFAGKRKQIHNTLVNNLQLDKNEVELMLKKIGVSPQARPQQLTIDQWLDLCKIISA